MAEFARGIRCRRAFRRLIGMVALSAIAFVAVAADLDSKVTFTISSQSLSSALLKFSEQAQIQVMTASADLAGITSPGVSGDRTPREALNALLRGTGLKFRAVAADAIAIEATRDDTSATAPSTSSTRINNESRTHLARTDSEAASSFGMRGDDSSLPSRDIAEVEEIVVTGSRLKRTSPDSFVERYTGKDIAKTGQSTLSGFLKGLPQVSLQAPISNFVSYGETSSVQLRGLPVGTTLVLIDGQRVSNSAVAGSSFDLNTIPAALIERVDVLASGSSAIYGSDAIAGVVNVVLKKDIDGFTGSGSYGRASSYDEQVYTFGGGGQFADLKASFAAAYQSRDKLLGRDRSITSDIDFSRYAAVGGRDARTENYCARGTIYSTSGNLLGLNSNVAAIPPNAGGDLTVADFAATAGTRNLCSNFTADHVIIDDLKQISGIGSLEYALADVRLTASLLYTRTEKDSSSAYGYPLTQQLVPASNAFNPFGTNIRVTTAVPALRGNINTTSLYRPALSAEGSFGGTRWDWNVTLSGSFDEADIFDLNGIGLRASALTAAFTSSDPATAFNPFSPSSTPQSVLDGLYNFVTNRYRSSAQVINSFARGPLFALPAGNVELVLGGEFDREAYRVVNAITGLSDGDRKVYAAFSEALVPLFDTSFLGAGEFSVAARYSDYSDFGTDVSPQYKLQWRPAAPITIEAAYSQAFRAPQLNQLNDAVRTFTGNTGIADPLRGGELVTNGVILSGGNANLRPETGTAKTLGIVWQSRGLRTSLNYFEIDEADRIVNPSSSRIRQGVVNNEQLFPGRVIRGPSTDGRPGTIQIFDLTYVNFGNLTVKGLDASIRQSIETRWGRLAPQIDITRLTKYEAAVSPGAPLADVLSKASTADVWAPRLKGTLGITYERQSFSARLAGRYVGSYDDYPGVNNLTRRIGNYWFMDASASLELGQIFGSGLPEMALSVSGTNILDKEPAYSNFLNSMFGYDPYQDDLMGRLVSITVGAKW